MYMIFSLLIQGLLMQVQETVDLIVSQLCNLTQVMNLSNIFLQI